MHRSLTLFLILVASSCGAESDTGYACELDGQCQYSFDVESNPNKQNAEELRASCDGLGGTFSTGTCAPAVAKCVYSGQRERHFYDGFAGVTYRTHTDLEGLQSACEIENGTLEVLQQPCETDADCSDGIMCSGIERCVKKETCTKFCTQASCEMGEPVCSADEYCEPNMDACLPR